MINLRNFNKKAISSYLKRGTALSLAVLTIGSASGCKNTKDDKKAETNSSILTSQLEEPGYKDETTEGIIAKKEDIIRFNEYASSKYYGSYTLFDSIPLTDHYNEVIDNIFKDLKEESQTDFSEIDSQKFREYIIMPYIIKQEKINNQNIEASLHEHCFDNGLIIPMDDDGLSRYESSGITNVNGYFNVYERRSFANGDFSTSVALSDKDNRSYIAYFAADNDVNYISTIITDEVAYLHIFNNNKMINARISEKTAKELFDRLNAVINTNNTFEINAFISENKEYLVDIFGAELNKIIVGQKLYRF